MIEIARPKYTLLLSHDPCEIFMHLGAAELHGLDYKSCKLYKNTKQDAYIAGWCNYYPNMKDIFVFINLSRCTSELETTLLLNHELMHASLMLHGWNLEHEEQIVSWAESETREAFFLIKQNLNFL